jgi:hypothetical protein
MPFGHDVVAQAGCIGIFAILINTLYLKSIRNLKLPVLKPTHVPMEDIVHANEWIL